VFAPIALNGVTARWGRPTTLNERLTSGVEAWAVCVDPVQGLESVSVGTGSNSDNAKALIVTCPFGKKLYDVGGGMSGGSPFNARQGRGVLPRNHQRDRHRK
jgi:hypothetical protein